MADFDISPFVQEFDILPDESKEEISDAVNKYFPGSNIGRFVSADYVDKIICDGPSDCLIQIESPDKLWDIDLDVFEGNVQHADIFYRLGDNDFYSICRVVIIGRPGPPRYYKNGNPKFKECVEDYLTRQLTGDLKGVLDL